MGRRFDWWLAMPACASVLALCASAARAQEPAPKPAQVAPHTHDLHEEILKLVGEVEQEMKALDKFLWDRGAEATGETARDALAKAKARAEAEVKKMERILELANTPHHPSKPGS